MEAKIGTQRISDPRGTGQLTLDVVRFSQKTSGLHQQPQPSAVVWARGRRNNHSETLTIPLAVLALQTPCPGQVLQPGTHGAPFTGLPKSLLARKQGPGSPWEFRHPETSSQVQWGSPLFLWRISWRSRMPWALFLWDSRLVPPCPWEMFIYTFSPSLYVDYEKARLLWYFS